VDGPFHHHDGAFTTIPIASTIANRVEKLIVKPSAAIAAKAPMMVTGTVVAGINIARQS
jgi:hypothetical protein